MFMFVYYIYAYTHTHTHIYIHIYIYTYIHIYIHTYMDVSVAEWLAWLTSNCGRIGAIGSSPSNGLRSNMWGQKGFNPLCQCVYIYVCIVKPDIQTIHRCSHTSIHIYTHISMRNNVMIIKKPSGWLLTDRIGFRPRKRHEISDYCKWSKPVVMCIYLYSDALNTHQHVLVTPIFL